MPRGRVLVQYFCIGVSLWVSNPDPGRKENDSVLFSAHTLCMKYITELFQLVNSSDVDAYILCLCTVEAKKARKTYNRELCRAHNHSLLLTLIGAM